MRLKLIKVETWVSRNEWYKYAIDYNNKNQKKIKIFEDRSPCKDPYIINDWVYISGLCRGVSVGKEEDFLIYYTQPCTDFIRKNPKDSDSILLLYGMTVIKKHSSHSDFYKQWNGDKLPNIIEETISSDCLSGGGNGSHKTTCNITYTMYPYGIERCICYVLEKNKKPMPVITSKVENSCEIYKKQLRFYLNRYMKKNLSVLECKKCKLSADDSPDYISFSKRRFNIAKNKKSILSSAVNGVIVKDFDKNTTDELRDKLATDLCELFVS